MFGMFLAIYLIGLLVWGIGMWIYYGFNRKALVTEQRNLARMTIFAPLWPLAIPAALLYTLKVFPWLWKKADWKGVEHDYEKADENQVNSRMDRVF